MVVSATWIRNNMLFSGEPYDRRLTEAELKVQRSLQKLSVPDWYLNKRSSPPKILNVEPIETRPPSWKCYTSHNSTMNSTLSNLSDTSSIDVPAQNNTPKHEQKDLIKSIHDKTFRQQKSPESNNRKSLSKPTRIEEMFETWIHETNLSANISKTFPKMSPSRKTENINIVLPPGPKIDLVTDLDEDITSNSFIYSNSSKSDSTKNEESPRKLPPTQKSNTVDETVDISMKASSTKGNFRPRSTVTSKCTPASLFSSTLIEDSPKPKKVRDIVKKLEVSNRSFQTPQKTSTFTWNMQVPVQNKKSSLGFKAPTLVQQRKFDLEGRSPARLLREQKQNLNVQSPCTRFLKSDKKSMELENVVRSKQLTREKGIVRGIIEVLAEKVNQSTLPRQKQTTKVNQEFVKKMVIALEKEGNTKSRQTRRDRRNSINEEIASSSEGEIKSYTTSTSVKDTDSSSDSDQRSPSLKSDEEDRFNYGCLTTTSNIHQDEDSVYWIPVSRCKLPRTSSLLSMMSTLSTNAHSPCVSPIRSVNEAEHQTTWGVTYKRTSSLSRKLFRIDETVVIDSGYSDKSDRSGISCRYSVEDGNWSEDTQTNTAT